MPSPSHPRIYHLTHVDNLPAVLAAGGLYSDHAMRRRGGPAASVGLSVIKTRRRHLPVTCHADLRVGDCVPFYFCPRSVMLYLLHRGNHPSLAYRGGQVPMVHLEADLHATVAWARTHGRAWAFSLSNAGARYATFRKDLDRLGEIDWDAVARRDFRASAVKEGKQAEFLVEESFPWGLVQRVGVAAPGVARTVEALLAGARHQPVVQVLPRWYF